MRLYEAAAVSVMLLVLLSRPETGHALICDFCYGTEDCLLGTDVPVVRCDEESVQLTNSSLVSFMRPLRTSLPTIQPLDDRYECVHLKATSVSGHVFLFTRGCVHRLEGSRHFCSLPHAAFQGSLECMACHGEDRCNNVPFSQDYGSGSRPHVPTISLICYMFLATVLTIFSTMEGK